MVRRLELWSALGACVLGTIWLALVAHLVRLLTGAYTAGLLLGPPMGWNAFWLYCLAMMLALVLLPVGASLHGRGAQVAGPALLGMSASCLVIGIAFYVLAPDQFWPFQVMPALQDSWLVVLGVVTSAFAAAAAIAGLTPLSAPLGKRWRTEEAGTGTPTQPEKPATYPAG